MRLRRTAAAVGALLLLLGGVSACTPEPIVVIPSATRAAVGPLVVGTPVVPEGADPEEGALLAAVYAEALNAAGVRATVKAADPADPTMLDRLAKGGVDIVSGYSSEFLQAAAPENALDRPGPVGASDVVTALKKAVPAQVAVLDAASAEDDGALAVTAVTAQKYQLKTIPDLAKVCDKLDFAGPGGFRTDPRGLAALKSDYGCVPKKYVQMPSDNNQLLLALLHNDVQVAELHTSSPAIYDNALVVLTDTKGVFPPQSVVPLVNGARVPAEVQTVLNKVTAALDNDTLTSLNRLAVGGNFATPAAVARAWLVATGLLKATS